VSIKQQQQQQQQHQLIVILLKMTSFVSLRKRKKYRSSFEALSVFMD